MATVLSRIAVRSPPGCRTAKSSSLLCPPALALGAGLAVAGAGLAEPPGSLPHARTVRVAAAAAARALAE